MKKTYLIAIIIIFLLVVVSAIVFTRPEKANNEQTAIKITLKPDIVQDSLLIQVDKKHCLSADYVPQDLVNISKYGIPSTQDFLLRKIVIQDLKEMIDQAKKEGIELRIISAYRSYQKQEQVYNSWVEQLGSQEANRQSAPPGCSQHQLGTAVDFNELDFSFADTPAGIWLYKNTLKYGWALSYPLNSENITGYACEPWHYRYIGKDNALQMQKSGLILSKFLDEKNNF